MSNARPKNLRQDPLRPKIPKATSGREIDTRFVRLQPIVLVSLRSGKERDLAPISSSCDGLMLDPTYLLYRAQNLVLTTAQRLLEE